MNKTILLAGLLTIISVNCYCKMITNCGQKEKGEGQFPIEWTLLLKSTPFNVTAVMEGKLYDKEGNVFYSFNDDNYLEVQKTIPYKVSLTWLSFPDKQFYEVTLPLPGDTIVALLQSGSGYPESDKASFEASGRIYAPYRFEDIRWLLSLDGTVHVKLKSSFNIIEVAQTQARKCTTPLSFYAWMGPEDKRDPVTVVDDFYRDSKWSEADYYRKYGAEKLKRFFCSQSYRYGIHIGLPAETDTLIKVETFYNNDDILTYRDKELIHLKEAIDRGVPKEFNLFWSDASQEENTLKIEFEREYLRSLYQKNISADVSWSLLIRVVETETHQIEIALTDGNRVISIPVDKVKYTFFKNHWNTYCNIPIGEEDRDKY